MRRWLLLGVLFLVLLTVAWWFFLISPRNARIAEEHDNLRAAQDQEVSLRTQAARLQEIEDSRVEYEAGIGRMETLIPQQPLLDEFIDEFFALGEATGVELAELSPSVPVAATDPVLREIRVEATVRGEFFEVLGLLFGLNDMERLVRVDSLNVISAPNEEGDTVLSVGMSLRLFTLSDLVPAAPSEPAEGGTSTTSIPADTTTSSSEEA